MKNIVLIGMMGCGKTTCAGILSRRLNRPAVDTDEQIVARAGRSVSEIFATDGESCFRDAETRIAEELSEKSGLIIATGGGLPLREENVRLLRKNGVIFWLKRDPAATFRSESMEGRPLAQAGQEAFVARFAQRAPLYARAADFIIEDFSAPETTAQCILDAYAACGAQP